MHDWDKEKEVTQHWSGAVIYPHKNTIWNNEENNVATKEAAQIRYIFLAWCVVGLCSFLGTIYYCPSLAYNIFGFISLAALFVSMAAFATELGMQSIAVKQLCGVVSKGGCNTVLKSKYAKGIWGITPSDIAVVYFAAQYFLYLLAAFNNSLFSVLPYLSLGSILIIGASLYTQAVVLKQWCALCLGIALLLTLQMIVSSFLLDNIFINSIVAFTVLFMISLAIVLPVKQLLKQNKAAKPKLLELKRWQSDASLFAALLEKEQTVDTTIWENDLILGDINAPIMITVACNPYCGPCAKAHRELDEMLEKFEGKVKVQMRFSNNPFNASDEKTKAVLALLEQVQILKNSHQIQTMITDWFEWMELDKWKMKWNNAQKIDLSKKLNSHYEWIKESNITHTPTFFVNGKRLPSKYSIMDMKRILPELVAY